MQLKTWLLGVVLLCGSGCIKVYRSLGEADSWERAHCHGNISAYGTAKSEKQALARAEKELVQQAKDAQCKAVYMAQGSFTEYEKAPGKYSVNGMLCGCKGVTYTKGIRSF